MFYFRTFHIFKHSTLIVCIIIESRFVLPHACPYLLLFHYCFILFSLSPVLLSPSSHVCVVGVSLLRCWLRRKLQAWSWKSQTEPRTRATHASPIRPWQLKAAASYDSVALQKWPDFFKNITHHVALLKVCVFSSVGKQHHCPTAYKLG